MTTKNTVVFAIIAVFALATTIGTTSVFAAHNLNYEDHIWSRVSGDGHLSYLNCSGDNCDLKLKTTSGVQGFSQSQLNSEVNDVASHFDGLGKKMSIDRVTSANSIIHQANLADTENGKTTFDNHCLAWFIWCYGGYDTHFIKMDVKLNDNVNDVKFQLTEDSTANPQEFDIRKTAGHELWHAMGIDHNNGSTSNISYYTYVFGATTGYVATTADKTDLGNQYP